MTIREFIKQTIRLEGGYVNNPHDVGGETKYGISKRANPDVDIKNLTEDEAIQIYYNRYWLTSYAPLWYSQGYQGLAFTIFDVKVSGQRAVLYDMQRILNSKRGSRHSIRVDGHPGKETLGLFLSLEEKNAIDEDELLTRMRALAPDTASRVAQATMRTQARMGLSRYDYTKGFKNRMVNRLNFAIGVTNA